LGESLAGFSQKMAGAAQGVEYGESFWNRIFVNNSDCPPKGIGASHQPRKLKRWFGNVARVGAKIALLIACLRQISAVKPRAP
jgi:hypothetical protein